MLLFTTTCWGDLHSMFDVGYGSDRRGRIKFALLITSPTMIVLAAIVAAMGLPPVMPEIEADE